MWALGEEVGVRAGVDVDHVGLGVEGTLVAFEVLNPGPDVLKLHGGGVEGLLGCEEQGGVGGSLELHGGVEDLLN